MFRGKEIEALGKTLKDLGSTFETSQEQFDQILQKVGIDVQEIKEGLEHQINRINELNEDLSYSFQHKISETREDVEKRFGDKLKLKTAQFQKIIDKTQSELSQVRAKIDEVNIGLSTVTGQRLMEISSEINTLNKDLNSSSDQSKLMQKDLEEIAQITKSLDVIREKIAAGEEKTSSFESRFSSFDNKLRQDIQSIEQKLTSIEEKRFESSKRTEETENRLMSTVDEMKNGFNEIKEQFNVFRTENKEIKDRLVDDERTIVSLEATLKEKDLHLRTKSDRLIQAEKELASAKTSVVRLENKSENLVREFDTIKKIRDSLQEKYIAIERDHTEYKAKAESFLAHNTHVRELLEQTEQGRILIELQKESPMKVEELSDKLGIATVIVKNAIYAMQEKRIVKFDPDSREVNLITPEI